VRGEASEDRSCQRRGKQSKERDASLSFNDREGRGTRSLSRDQVGKKERWMSCAFLSRGGNMEAERES
jgi:hypothetical protein